MTGRSTDLIVGTGQGQLDLVPSAIGLAAVEVELAATPQRERRLASVLGGLTDAYDHVFIDCPPSLGLLTVNALTAADGVLIPLQCEYYALEGLGQLLATIDLVRDNLNPDLAVDGVVLTMYDARTRLSSDVADEVRRHLGGTVYRSRRAPQRAALGGAQLRAVDRHLQPGVTRRAGLPRARRGVPGTPRIAASGPHGARGLGG